MAATVSERLTEGQQLLAEAKRATDVKTKIDLVTQLFDTHAVGATGSTFTFLLDLKSRGLVKELKDVVDLSYFFDHVIGVSHVGAICDPEMAEAIIRSTKVEEISCLCSQHLTLEVTRSIATILKGTTHITKVDLGLVAHSGSSAYLNDETIVPIAEALESNTSVQELFLSGTRVSQVGLMTLFDSILKNPKTGLNRIVLPRLYKEDDEYSAKHLSVEYKGIKLVTG